MGKSFRPPGPHRPTAATTALVLVADDDAAVRAVLIETCESLGYRTREASSGREALEQIEVEQPACVLLDLDIPDGPGMDVLVELRRLPQAPAVVVITGFADVRTAVEVIQLGALDLIEKPVDRERLGQALGRAREGRRTPVEAPDHDPRTLGALGTGAWIGDSRALREVSRHVQRAASTPRTTVLITGESGVGKELVARAVHGQSARAERPFVALNCAALAESLLEAELFGYESGTFTGGDPKGREGLVAAAEGGTLLLDEVGEMVPPLQAKLLRVLQERSYRRVGGHEDRPMDVRIVASTNRDLVAMVEQGSFREDLYYRLNVLSIVVPPLRERLEDIDPIARHFLDEVAHDLGSRFCGFSTVAMDQLRGHSWPGNVRELRNTIERAAILACEGEIQPEHLGLAPSAGPRATTPLQLPLADRTLKTMERALIRQVLDECDGNRSRAARELGINRATLYNKLRAYEIGA